MYLGIMPGILEIFEEFLRRARKVDRTDVATYQLDPGGQNKPSIRPNRRTSVGLQGGSSNNPYNHPHARN